MKTKQAKIAQAKPLTRSEDRLARIAKGLCGVRGCEGKCWINEKGAKVAECKKHFLYFRAKAKEYAAAKAKAKMTPVAMKGKEGRIPRDMINDISRAIAHKIGGDATVQLQPMTRGDLFNAIRTGVQAATRRVGFTA